MLTGFVVCVLFGCLLAVAYRALRLRRALRELLWFVTGPDVVIHTAARNSGQADALLNHVHEVLGLEPRSHTGAPRSIARAALRVRVVDEFTGPTDAAGRLERWPRRGQIQ